MGYLKGKSSLVIFEEHANLKYNYGNRHFWAEGYYVSTVGLNKNTIKRYIQNQDLEDKIKMSTVATIANLSLWRTEVTLSVK